jgi:CO/xanthine dehydrogenase Mo-binding subunit
METLNAVSRRDFLRAGGAVVVSFASGAVLPKLASAQGSAPTADLGKPLDANEVDSFLAIHADGSVTLYTSRVDVGTGLRTAMSQIAAEELGVPIERFTVVEGDTALTPDHGGTGGSSGIPVGAARVRLAAATARQELLRLGAGQLKRPSAELTILNGVVQPTAGGSGVSFAALLGGKQVDLKIDAKAPLKDHTQYTIVGKPILRSDVSGKTNGRNVFMQDLVVPGMLHGRVIRPPAIGAKLISVDETSTRNIPGVSVVRIESFLGVVANDEWAAVRAARELKATWSEWEGLPGSDDLERHVRESAVDHDEVLVNKGDAAAALPAAAKQLSSMYSWPYQSHASLGPSCALADVREDGTTIWTSTQGTYGLRGNLAKIFAMPPEKLRVIFLDGSGSYGGNGNDDAAADAFLLSRNVKRPVRVQWMRQDEHGWDPKGPPQYLSLRGGLDAQGRIVSWETQMWLPKNIPGNRALLGIEAAGISQDHGQGAGLMTLNGDPPYASPNTRVVIHYLADSALRISNLRAPGKIANVFAAESFADEMAAAAGADAVQFRLRGLSDPRAIEVIKRAANMIGWQARPSPNPQAARGNTLVGRGIAYMRYKQAENYVAIAMEVAVDRASGKIEVQRISCAHDCGLIVNPDGLRNQVEGCILQTLSRALYEEVKFDRSRVTSVDWSSYPILRFPEVPPVDVALIDRPEIPPVGAGEAATAPVAAALANAIFDATGVRLRAVPFTPARVESALAKT